jgi:UDP-N-acetylglucosamine 2-epimerase (non-hydrolysing)
MVKVCIVAGARPNFIKVAPLIRAMEKSDGICYELVYAGRADDATLEGTLFDDLQISRPTVFLDVDSVSLNEITGRVMGAFEKYLSTHPTDVVIVVDDLASTMAAAIVTKKQGVRLAHLVAGTRSFDINMPKEVNRLVIDGLSDLLFTAGMSASSITNREGAEQSRVYMVGNILIDNLRYNHDRWQRPPLMDETKLADGRYLVFTLNRRALLRNEENLKLMMDALTSRADVPVVAVLRQEARRVVETIVPPTPGFIYADPLPYLQFGYLTSHAMGIVTDSGNVAEEATFNGVPCITLNSYTEHIETVKVGTNVLVGEDAGQLAEALQEMVEGRWKKASLPERWDGRTAERIVRILTNEQ